MNNLTSNYDDKKIRPLACSLGLFGAVCAPAISALEYDYELYSSAEYTDNISQNHGGSGPSGNILSGGIAFDARTTTSSTIVADVVGDFSRHHYSSSDLSDETHKFLDASASWQPSSTNFSLTVLESLRQSQENRRSIRTVNNLRDINVFSVVPSYYFDLTSRSRVRASYAWTTVDEELDLASRDVQTVTGSYEYSVSNLSDWSLNVSQSEISFDSRPLEYEQESAFFRWTYTGRLTVWNLDIGQQRIVDRPDSEELMSSFSWERTLSDISTAGLYLRTGYSDALDSAVSGRMLRLVPNSDVALTDDLVTERQAGVFYNLDRGPFNARVSAEVRRLETAEAIYTGGEWTDEERYMGTATANYRFSQGNALSPFGISVMLQYMDEEFVNDGVFNEIGEARFRLNYFANRSTLLFFEVRARDASGTGPLSDTDEAAALVGIRFSPRGGI